MVMDWNVGVSDRIPRIMQRLLRDKSNKFESWFEIFLFRNAEMHAIFRFMSGESLPNTSAEFPPPLFIAWNNNMEPLTERAVPAFQLGLSTKCGLLKMHAQLHHIACSSHVDVV